MVYRVPKETSSRRRRCEGSRGEGGGGGGEGEVNADGVKGIISACHHGACLGIRVRSIRICQFAASAAGNVSSGSVRASVTRDLQHGGAQEKQEAQRCKPSHMGENRGESRMTRDIRRGRLTRNASARDLSIRETCQR